MKASYPANATVAFMELCDELPGIVQAAGLAPDMAPILAAQWALESGWGTSKLARQHLNYAGMKWRDIMKPYAKPVTYTDWQGKTEKYCKFNSNRDYVLGYFHRLDKLGPYDGWRARAEKGGTDFIKFIGPIWLGMSPEQNQEYIVKVLALAENRFDG